MGVIACDRGNCQNIMCDRHSGGYGNLCSDCFDELVRLGVKTDIAQFMESDVPKDRQEEEAAAFYYFNRIFPT
jgi:hypothetical protein